MVRQMNGLWTQTGWGGISQAEMYVHVAITAINRSCSILHAAMLMNLPVLRSDVVTMHVRRCLELSCSEGVCLLSVPIYSDGLWRSMEPPAGHLHLPASLASRQPSRCAATGCCWQLSQKEQTGSDSWRCEIACSSCPGHSWAVYSMPNLLHIYFWKQAMYAVSHLCPTAVPPVSS